jgi:hypothetical protein
VVFKNVISPEQMSKMNVQHLASSPLNAARSGEEYSDEF